MNTKIKYEGFTLIELMITVALVAILLALSAPYFRETITSNKIGAEANNLKASLNLARSTAARLNQPVTLCKSADGDDCTTNDNWEQGWITFNDLNMDGTVDSGGVELVIQEYSPLPTGYTLRSTAQFSDLVTFLPQGNARGSASLNETSSFRICATDASGEEDDAKARQVFINITGRIRSQKGLDSGIDCP
ncbi:MAG TPA: prepilin-type N-terminal cleavage/methylation domain-containing protein [Porticoccus sp.]|nr:prepilin-type N-terminal cleavage/methylation domain-containing protein [Porticoccus sp.]